MKTNRKFGKIENGKIIYAPYTLIGPNSRITVSPTTQMYADAGWLPVQSAYPSPPAGKHVSSVSYEVSDNLIRTIYEYEDDKKIPRTFSKLKFYSVLVELGKWTEVKTWLENSGLWDAFVLAQVVKEDNPQFILGVTTFKEKFGFSDVQVEEIFSKCVAEISV